MMCQCFPATNICSKPLFCLTKCVFNFLWVTGYLCFSRYLLFLKVLFILFSVGVFPVLKVRRVPRLHWVPASKQWRAIGW